MSEEFGRSIVARSVVLFRIALIANAKLPLIPISHWNYRQ
jgi:hypothetical protein